MPQCGCVLRKPKAGLILGESSCNKDHSLSHLSSHGVTEYYGPPECDALCFTVRIVTEYYGPPQCDAVSLTGWTVTEYYQAPALVCWPVCRMKQQLDMRLFLWTHGSHGLR